MDSWPQMLTQTMPAKMRTIPSHWLRSSRSRRKIHERRTVTAPYSDARTLTTDTGPMCKPALLDTNAAVSINPTAASIHQTPPCGSRMLWRAGSANTASETSAVSRITQTETASPTRGTTWKPRNQNMKPKPTAAKIAQPTPRDKYPPEDVPPGADASFAFGANDIAARITPVSVTAIPTPRSA